MFLPTVIIRHRKENLKKCSLRGLEGREDMRFYTYPQQQPPFFSAHLLLTMDGPPLTAADKSLGLCLVDGTWRYAARMIRQWAHLLPVERRSLPVGYRTAYPRCQEECPYPEWGLASVEALYLAYMILGRPTQGLLDHYHWRDLFLHKNGLST